MDVVRPEILRNSYHSHNFHLASHTPRTVGRLIKLLVTKITVFSILAKEKFALRWAKDETARDGLFSTPKLWGHQRRDSEVRECPSVYLRNLRLDRADARIAPGAENQGPSCLHRRSVFGPVFLHGSWNHFGVAHTYLNHLSREINDWKKMNALILNASKQN